MSKVNSPAMERVGRLRQIMAEKDIPAILITSPENRRYFSGFVAGDTQMNESSGALLITPKKLFLLTDFRYAEAARLEAQDYEVLVYKAGLGAELAKNRTVKNLPAMFFEADYISVGQLLKIEEHLGDSLGLFYLDFDLAQLRSSKSADELKLIKKALDITEQAVGELWQKMEPGMTENEAAFFLETRFRQLGAEGPSFEVIVASGPNAALPHAVVSERKIKDGDTVIIDCGAKYKGYAADLTRTKIMGTPKKWQMEIYRIVKEAQDLAIKALKPGLTGAKADQVARRHIAQAGFGEFFGHSLGHGLGLAIHERPTLSPRYDKPLVAGEVVTVEPGIYLPGKGGVRLEQLVQITEKGARLLNKLDNFYNF